MEITDIIGKGKAFEPPFRVVFDSGNVLYPIVADSNGEMFCCGLYDIDIANHIVELLNERWIDDERRIRNL